MHGSSATPYLLEVHHFDGGARYKSFPRTQTRPDWVPSGEQVGLRNEFKLSDGSAIVEFCRFATSGGVTDWVAVYFPSEDAEFGKRGNYAGVGIWLHDQYIADADQVLDFFQQIANAISKDGLSPKIEENIEKLASQFIPGVILPASGAFAGQLSVPPSSQFASTSFELIETELPLERKDWSLAADRILLLQHVGDMRTMDERPSRYLLLLSSAAPKDSSAKFTAIGSASDNHSKILREVYGRLSTVKAQAESKLLELKNSGTVIEQKNETISCLEQQIAQIQHENENLQRQISEFDRDNPIPARLSNSIEKMLGGIENQSYKIDSIQREITSWRQSVFSQNKLNQDTFSRTDKPFVPPDHNSKFRQNVYSDSNIKSKSNSSDIIFYCLMGLLALLIIGLLGYAIYKFV